MNDFFNKKCCDRCGKSFLDGTPHTMSFMNKDAICMDCRDAEEKHPLYEEARKAELEAVKRGDFNYPGLFYGQAYPFTKELKARNISIKPSVGKLPDKVAKEYAAYKESMLAKPNAALFEEAYRIGVVTNIADALMYPGFTVSSEEVAVLLRDDVNVLKELTQAFFDLEEERIINEGCVRDLIRDVVEKYSA